MNYFGKNSIQKMFKLESMSYSESENYFEKYKSFQYKEEGQHAIDCNINLQETNIFQEMSSEYREIYPTFRGFLLYVMDKILSCGEETECFKKLDVHFIRLYDRCSLCTRQYDVILKVQTIFQIDFDTQIKTEV